MDSVGVANPRIKNDDGNANKRFLPAPPTLYENKGFQLPNSFRDSRPPPSL